MIMNIHFFQEQKQQRKIATDSNAQHSTANHVTAQRMCECSLVIVYTLVDDGNSGSPAQILPHKTVCRL